MHGNLRVQRMRQQSALRIVQRQTGFIAGGFDAEDQHGTEGRKEKKGGMARVLQSVIVRESPPHLRSLRLLMNDSKHLKIIVAYSLAMPEGADAATRGRAERNCAQRTPLWRLATTSSLRTRRTRIWPRRSRACSRT
jgi:hypothetical protein